MNLAEILPAQLSALHNSWQWPFCCYTDDMASLHEHHLNDDDQNTLAPCQAATDEALNMDEATLILLARLDAAIICQDSVLRDLSE